MDYKKKLSPCWQETKPRTERCSCSDCSEMWITPLNYILTCIYAAVWRVPEFAVRILRLSSACPVFWKLLHQTKLGVTPAIFRRCLQKSEHSLRISSWVVLFLVGYAGCYFVLVAEVQTVGLQWCLKVLRLVQVHFIINHSFKAPTWGFTSMGECKY